MQQPQQHQQQVVQLRTLTFAASPSSLLSCGCCAFVLPRLSLSLTGLTDYLSVCLSLPLLSSLSKNNTAPAFYVLFTVH